MVSVLVSSAVDRGFNPRSGQIKDYKISILVYIINCVDVVQSGHKHLIDIQLILAMI